jgi:hypothetical protein
MTPVISHGSFSPAWNDDEKRFGNGDRIGQRYVRLKRNQTRLVEVKKYEVVKHKHYNTGLQRRRSC